MSSRAALSRCIPTALVVGTVLSAINQGATILDGNARGATWIRIASNYAVPFVVSNVGYVSAVLPRRRSRPADGPVDDVDPTGR
ncbi:MAG: nitrate/nitrite transporter NrtS [Actinomycetota bacterium]